MGTVAVGTTETLTVTGSVNAGTEGSTLVDRFAVARPPGALRPESGTRAPTTRPNRAPAHDILPPPGAPELMQSKTVDQTTALPGDILTYSMGVANDGTAAATGVTATDTLPAGVTFVAADTHGAGTYDSSTGIWTIGTVASEATATLTITVTVNSGTEATTQTNRFIVTSSGIPVVVLDACSDVPTESCASTTIPGVPRLVQNKTVDQTSAPVGAALTYTMTLVNTGNRRRRPASWRTTPCLRASRFVSADTHGFGTFDPTTGAWNIGTIAGRRHGNPHGDRRDSSPGRRFDARQRLPSHRAPGSAAARRRQSLPEPQRGVVMRHHDRAGHPPAHPVQGSRRRDGAPSARR